MRKNYYTTKSLKRDVISVQAYFADIYLWGMLDRSMQGRMELAREIQLTDWTTAGNLSNRSSGVKIHLRVIFVLVLGVTCTLRSAVG